jgi:hypothetical protein
LVRRPSTMAGVNCSIVWYVLQSGEHTEQVRMSLSPHIHTHSVVNTQSHLTEYRTAHSCTHFEARPLRLRGWSTTTERAYCIQCTPYPNACNAQHKARYSLSSQALSSERVVHHH